MPFNLPPASSAGWVYLPAVLEPHPLPRLKSRKERLVILAAIPGFISLVITFSMMRVGQYLFPCKPDHFCFQTWWIRTVPFEYIGTAMSALLLAGLAWIPWNRLKKCRREVATDRMIDQDGVALDVLLKDAQKIPEPFPSRCRMASFTSDLLFIFSIPLSLLNS